MVEQSGHLKVVPLKDLVRYAGQLVTLPEAYHRLKACLDEPEPDFDLISRIIESDTALSARLLRLVNSPIYAGIHSGRVDRISYAVHLSGSHLLKNLLLTTVISNAVSHLATSREDIKTFWQHSVFCGLVAMQLAKRCSVLHPDRLMVGGLVHDIGHLVMYRRYHGIQLGNNIPPNTDPDDVLKVERDRFGYTHCDVGAGLVQFWQLPVALRQITEWHHEPHKSESGTLEVSLVHIANAVTNQNAMRHQMGPADDVIDPWVWEFTELSPDCLDEVIEQAKEQFGETLKILMI